MKQILQHLKTGQTLLENVPVPALKPGNVLIQSHASLISAGTEKMLVEFSKANIISKARLQPERVKQVFDKIKADGLIPTLENVFTRLDEPLPLGYCNAGEVIAVGENVTEFKKGDRVISNGPHAEFVCVPKNLVAKIPGEMDYEEACFAVIGAVGLQGIRLIQPQMGETVAVIGLGLVGLLTAQLLNASGCKVIGIDIHDDKIELATELGIQSFNSDKTAPEEIINALTNNSGADAVIIAAAAHHDDIINTAAKISRKKGKIVLIGVVDLHLNRNEFYKKELSFQVSCSYGPGRYDEEYEQKGMDYPLPYVRWTEKRNFETILDAISKNKILIKKLITQKIQLESAPALYSRLNESNAIASVIVYPEQQKQDVLIKHRDDFFIRDKSTVIGIIGAGNFSKMTLLPALKKLSATIKYIASNSGVSSSVLAKKYSIPNSTSDYKILLDDPDVNLIIIATRHNSHMPLTVEALKAGKNVFVEKPLAIRKEEIDAFSQLYNENKNLPVSVGFNRRFSPYIIKAQQWINSALPAQVIMTINAGRLAEGNWLADKETGGGRITGEACHFIDLAQALTGSMIGSVSADATDDENVIITLHFKNNAQAVINYFSNGSKAYSKERIEIYNAGRTIVIDNFRSMTGYGFKGYHSMRSKQDKGHLNQFKLLLHSAASGNKMLIPLDQVINSAKATLAVRESIDSGSVIIIS